MSKVVNINSRLRSSVIPYHAVPVGACFKVLKEEYVRHPRWARYRQAPLDFKIENDGTYVKIGDSHAKNISDHKDAIFLMRTPCRIVPINVDSKQYEDWAIVNQGKPTNVTPTSSVGQRAVS